MSLSLRKDSLNTKLLRIAESVMKDQGEQIDAVDLNDFLLPYYNAEIEEKAIPELAVKLGARMKACTGMVIASPEYNYSMPGHFKNTFDWLSRIRPMPYAGKGLYLMSASPSLVGGNRGLWALRVPFEATGVFVYPDMFSLAGADKAFEENGSLKDAKLAERLKSQLGGYVKFTKAISGKGA